jgi:hypothetical protein
VKNVEVVMELKVVGIVVIVEALKPVDAVRFVLMVALVDNVVDVGYNSSLS